MKLTIIGCSGSMPGPYSPASCYMVSAATPEGGTTRVLLDLGSGASGPLQRHCGLHDVDAVALSHLHPDHCSDLWGLYVAWNYHPLGSPDRRLPVYAPSGATDTLTAILGLSDPSQLLNRFDIRTWRTGCPETIGPLQITPYPALHPVEAYCLRVHGPSHATGTVDIAFSGDTDDCPGLREAASNTDALLAEASFVDGRDTVRDIHLTGLRAGDVAAAANTKRLLLTHIPPYNDPAVSVAEARTRFDGHLEAVKPDMSYQL